MSQPPSATIEALFRDRRDVGSFIFGYPNLSPHQKFFDYQVIHWTGTRNPSHYISEDGGPRLQRSVFFERSMHGYAEHPTQKPEAVIEKLLRYACPAGGLVLDPFAGSGSTGLAAKTLGLRFVGIELNPDYVELAKRRLNLI